MNDLSLNAITVGQKLSRLRVFDIGSILLFAYTMSLIIFSYRQGLTAYTKILGVLVAAYVVFRHIQGRMKLSIPLEFVCVFLWLLWAMLTSMFAGDMDLAMSKVFTLMLVIGVSFTIYALITWQGNSSVFWIGLVIATLVSTGMTLNNLDQYTNLGGRVAGTVGNPNLFSVVLVAAMAVTVTFAATARSRMLKFLLAVLSVVFLYMVAQTGSRKGMIGCMLCIVLIMSAVLAEIRRRSVPKFMMATLAALTVLVASGIYLASSDQAERMQQAMNAFTSGDISEGDSSLQERTGLLKLALEQALDHPIFGLGLDNFREVEVAPFQSVGLYSHTNYMEIAVSTGLPGLCLYVAMYVVLFFKIFSLRLSIFSQDTVGAYAIASSLFLMMFSFDFAMVTYYEKLWWLLLAGLIAHVELLKRKMPMPDKLQGSIRPAEPGFLLG